MLARKILTDDQLDTDTQRIDDAFLRVVVRRPTDAELQVLTAGLNRSRTEYSTNRQAALDLLSVGESPHRGDLDAVEHAAWASVCLTLLNLDEALSRE